jgi:hypothetical protein
MISQTSCRVDENPEISIITDTIPGNPVNYGLNKLTEALNKKNITYEKVGTETEAQGKRLIVSGLCSGEGLAARMMKEGNRIVPGAPEALTIWKTETLGKPAWVISGFDDRGVLYGLLDVADRIGWSTDRNAPMSEVKETTGHPAVTERAISIYTMNRAYWESRFYDEAYWERYLDMLAKNRFNSIVIIFGYENGGFLAPCYPYFYDVEEFPGIRMVGISPKEQQRNLKALNLLIAKAHERGINFTVGIWDHIYRGGVQGGGIQGTQSAPIQPVDGLVWGLTGDNLTAYTKAALAKLINLVPDLDGIQFRMHNESGLKKGEQEKFWADVFRMMKEAAPDLRLDLRAKELPEKVIEDALDIGLNFRITTKYWMEQMGMPYHPTKTNPEKSPIRHSYAYLLRYPKQYKIHWRLWNGGTSRILLWGDPDYVRRFVESTHLYDGDGFEVNEPLATKMEAQPHDAKPFELLNPAYRYYEWEFERYWHFFQVFGRIGYNPEAPPDIWNHEFEQRFGKEAGDLIEKALHMASRILPRIITSSYPYSLFPTTRGWAEKQHLGDLPNYAHAKFSDRAQFAGFGEEAKIQIEGGETARILPTVNSAWFEQTSIDLDQLIVLAENAIGDKRTNEFISTITDLKILSKLALYHSRRILAAVSYRIYEYTGNISALDDAISHERNAIEAWQKIIEAAGDVYKDNLRFGVCEADLCGHWKDELISLEKGLAKLVQEQERLLSQTDNTNGVRYQIRPNKIKYDTILQISHTPVTSLPVGTPLSLTAKVTASTGVKWVRIRYRSVNQEFEYLTLSMEPEGEENSYRVTVPSSLIDPKWDLMYYLEVMDNHHRGRIYPDLNKGTPYIIVKLRR